MKNMSRKLCLLFFVNCVLHESKANLSDTLLVDKNSEVAVIDTTALQLSTVIITGKSADDYIMKIDLNKVPVNTSQDLLRKVPGLFIAQHAGGGKAEQIFLRGFDNDHGTDISILADGMPVNIVSHAHGQGYSDLHFLIPETIEAISFGKGAYYAEKGDFNTSGYVDFNTYDRLKNNMIKMEGGSFNTLRTVGMFRLFDTPERNAYVTTEYNFTNGPFHVKQNFNRLNLFGKFSGKIDEQNSVDIIASTFSSNWNGSGQIPLRVIPHISRFGSVDTTEGGNTSRTNLILKWHHQFNDAAHLNSTFYYSKYNFELFSNFTFYLIHPEDGDQIQQIDNRDVYGSNHQFVKNFDFASSSLKVVAGTGFRYDDIHDLELNYVVQRERLNERISQGVASVANMNAYLSGEWHYKKWVVTPGARIDWFHFNYYDKLTHHSGQSGVQTMRLSPKLNILYNANSELQIFLKSGMGFHSNDVRAVLMRNGQEILPYTIGTDLGAILNLSSHFVLIPTLWYTYLQHEYVWNGDSYGTSDVGNTRRVGLDLTIRYQPYRWLYFDSDINLAKPRLLGEAEGNNFVDLAPTGTSTGGIAVKLNNGFSGNFRYRYMHSRPANQDNSIVAKGYFVNDLVLSYQRKVLVFSVQIQNLFNTNWNEAMFAETTRLKGERAGGFDQLTLTPGTPFYLKAGIAFKF